MFVEIKREMIVEKSMHKWRRRFVGHPTWQSWFLLWFWGLYPLGWPYTYPLSRIESDRCRAERLQGLQWLLHLSLRDGWKLPTRAIAMVNGTLGTCTISDNLEHFHLVTLTMLSYYRQIYRAIQLSGLDEKRNTKLRGCWGRTAIQQRGYHASRWSGAYMVLDLKCCQRLIQPTFVRKFTELA